MRSLRFRECGLYEASDLLLGDHLTEKSATVKWIDVSMPHKRNRRLKDQSVIEIPRTSLRIVFTQTRYVLHTLTYGEIQSFTTSSPLTSDKRAMLNLQPC